MRNVRGAEANDEPRKATTDEVLPVLTALCTLVGAEKFYCSVRGKGQAVLAAFRSSGEAVPSENAHIDESVARSAGNVSLLAIALSFLRYPGLKELSGCKGVSFKK